MNYIDVERELRGKINGIEIVRPYESDNFVTPNVIGFVPIGKSYKYEISYGIGFGGGWIVGVTLFKNGRLYKNLQGSNKCFLIEELDDLNQHIRKYKEIVMEG